MCIRDRGMDVQLLRQAVFLEDQLEAVGEGGGRHRELRSLTAEPVSYTHLDVYKRQGPSSAVRKIDPSYGSDQHTDFLETVNQR